MKKLLHNIARDMLAPLGRRAGSLVGSAIAGYDVAPDQVLQTESAVALIVGIAFDLVLARAFRVELENVKPAPKPRKPKVRIIDLPDHEAG